MKLLDCTLRDGGYYTNWDFSNDLINDYLESMRSINMDFVELGFRSLKNDGFKGGCAFTTDSFIDSLGIPSGLRIGVMINASELAGPLEKMSFALNKLFKPADKSQVSLVRIASHIHEIEQALEAVSRLKDKGYIVGLNLMQIADRSKDEIVSLAKKAGKYPLDVLYFADSMGGMNPSQTREIISAFREGWSGDLGIHTHDNMGQAVANSVTAVEEGVSWVDGTVTGMGRGPGNAKTEYLILALEAYRDAKSNMIPLLGTIRKHFQILQSRYSWGSNPYYYLAGKYGIHPSYIQEMLGDRRYSEEDILAVIEHLKSEGGKKFSLSNLESSRQFYSGEPRGKWNPSDVISGRDVLILGTGPGVEVHRSALETFIRNKKPFVIALNTQTGIANDLIDIRTACHPVRLLADCGVHAKLPQPLATPFSMLPHDVQSALKGKEIMDFGLNVTPGSFSFFSTYANVPISLVVAYSMAIATSGKAQRILLAGFDGYPPSDARNVEMDNLLREYEQSEGSIPFLSITPSQYQLNKISVYAMDGGE